MSLLVIGEDPTRLKSINKLSLSEKHLGEVEWVHAWIKENYQAIFGKLNYEIIGQEVDVSGEGPEGYLDFLAIDLETGDTVILECKRDDFKHRDLIGQAVEYAAGVSKFTTDELNSIYNNYTADSANTLQSLLAQYHGDISKINKHQKIVLVAQNSTKNEGSFLRLKALCGYLRSLDIDINILEMKWYSNNANAQKPGQGDIVEFEFIWDINPLEVLHKTGNKKSSHLISEDEFLFDKTDKAIEIYNALLDKMNATNIIKYKQRPNSQWITFYGKSKAFMVVILQDEFIKVRLRFNEDYQCVKLEKLGLNTDKLTKQDGFLYQGTINESEQLNDIIQCIVDSYEYNTIQ